MVGAAHAGSLAGAQQAARTPLEAQGERQAVLAWLAQHRVNDMLCALLETLCVERPANPHQYIVDWMCAQYPAAIKVSVGAAQSVGPLSTHVEVEKEPAEEDDEFETEEKPTSGAPDMSIQMAMSLNRNTVSRRRRAVSAESVDPDKIKSLYTRKLHAKPAGVRARLLESVSKNFLFYTLDAEQKGVLLDAMFERRCEAGETVIAQGAEGDNFYLVYEGACDVYLAKDGAESCVLHCVEGDTFGELALLYNAPRSASVRTATACTLYAVDRFTFKSIMMETTMSKRETYESFLAKVPLLSSLTPNERRTVADALKPTTYRDGEAIIHQNEAGETFFLVEKGEVVCTSMANGLVQELGRCAPGQYFGEIALITNRPRCATVTAVGDVTVLALDRRTFTRVLGPLTAVLRRNMAMHDAYMVHKI